MAFRIATHAAWQPGMSVHAAPGSPEKTDTTANHYINSSATKLPCGVPTAWSLARSRISCLVTFCSRRGTESFDGLDSHRLPSCDTCTSWHYLQFADTYTNQSQSSPFEIAPGSHHFPYPSRANLSRAFRTCRSAPDVTEYRIAYHSTRWRC